MNFYELMTKYVNKEIDIKTIIQFTRPNFEQTSYTLKEFIQDGWNDFERFTFEIVKQKKKMYVHEFYERVGDGHQVKLIRFLTSETWEQFNFNNDLVLFETKEVEVDCD